MQGFGLTSIKAPYLGNSGKYAINQQPAPRRKTASSIIQANITKAKNSRTPINSKKVIPSKKDIREYCMQDEEFARAFEIHRLAGKGSSAAIRTCTNRRIELLRTLPFGPVLKD